MPVRAVLLLLLAATSLAACGEDGTTGAPGAPSVVATTTIAADLASQVAGERAEVASILRPNTDPHDYEPRPSDARRVADADLVLRSGGEADAWLEDLLANAGGDPATVVLLDGVRRLGDDPHWWQDPRNGIRAAGLIRDALIAADPDGRRQYTANAARLTARLEGLDRAIAACIDAIPESRRRLVTNHDALRYFADRYGIAVLGSVIPALSTKAQASAGEVRDLVAAIRREGVRTIFPESALSSDLEDAIAKEAGAKVGPALYTDALGPEGSEGDSYAAMLRFNARAIAEGLGGSTCALPR